MKRFAWLIPVALLTACALPLEQHGGVAPHQAPADAVFLAGGAALDGAIQLARRPWWQRAAVVVGVAWTLRIPRFGGRYEGVGLTIPLGAFGSEWLGLLLRGHH